MKIDLEDPNVIVIKARAEAIRSYFDGWSLGNALPEFNTELDNVQGMVFGKESGTAYLVIEVRP